MQSVATLFFLVITGATASCPPGDESCETADSTNGDALLAINRTRIKKHTTRLYRKCIELGTGEWGGSNDNDNVFGCSGSKAMVSLWDHNDAKANNFPGTDGSSPGSKEDCWLTAGSNPQCGSRVLYHEDGISCMCHKEGKHCDPKTMPSFLVAECECGFHPAKQCRYGSNQQNTAPLIDDAATAEECFAECIAQQSQAGGGHGCCQYRVNNNGQGGRCRFYRDLNNDLELDSPWGRASVVTVSNQDKYAFSLSECANV